MNVEQVARAELALLPEALRSSTLAAAVLDLAARLDAEPTDRDATALARELRLGLADLRRLAAAEGGEGVLDVRDAALGD